MLPIRGPPCRQRPPLILFVFHKKPRSIVIELASYSL